MKIKTGIYKPGFVVDAVIGNHEVNLHPSYVKFGPVSLAPALYRDGTTKQEDGYRRDVLTAYYVRIKEPSA